MEKTLIQSAPMIRDSLNTLPYTTESFIFCLWFLLLASDGTIYAGSNDARLYAINPDGTQKWVIFAGNWIQSSSAVGLDGILYVGSDDHNLYAIYGGSKGLAASSWPKFHANNQNTGLATKPTSVKTETKSTSEFALLSNFPNPFNPETAIRFCLPRSCDVEIFICTITGRRVKTWVKRIRDAGWHTVQWDGKDDSGSPAESGVYFCNVKSEMHHVSVKMVLMR